MRKSNWKISNGLKNFHKYKDIVSLNVSKPVKIGKLVEKSCGEDIWSSEDESVFSDEDWFSEPDCVEEFGSAIFDDLMLRGDEINDVVSDADEKGSVEACSDIIDSDFEYVDESDSIGSASMVSSVCGSVASNDLVDSDEDSDGEDLRPLLEPKKRIRIVREAMQGLDKTLPYITNKVCPSFDLSSYVRELRDLASSLPADANAPLFEGSLVDKATFAENLVCLFNSKSWHMQSRKDLLLFLVDHFPKTHVNLPFDASNSSKKTLMRQMEDYLSSLYKSSFSHLMFHCCPNEFCCVFVGPLSHAKHCPTCGADRFMRCNRDECATMVPFEWSKCVHLHYCIPQHVIHYKPIIPLLIELISSEEFLCSSTFEYVRPSSSDYKYCDVLDGDIAVKNLVEMKDKFISRPVTKEHSKVIFLMVNLLLAQFYDGAQLYKRKVANFWPFLISILNLPPSYRAKLGVGSFDVALFTGESGTPAEEFLFVDCFVSELELLYEGLTVCVGYQKYVFLQARLISHQLDTKAIEDVLDVQASCSLDPCPFCKGVSGFTHPGLGTNVQLRGHRNLLPDNHPLRCFGQHGMCCPANFHDNSKESTEEAKDLFAAFDESKFDKDDLCIPNAYMHVGCVLKDASPTCSGSEPFDMNEEERKATYYDENNWLHSSTKLSDFEHYLYYPYFDFRKGKKHKRVTNKKYLLCASMAQQITRNADRIESRLKARKAEILAKKNAKALKALRKGASLPPPKDPVWNNKNVKVKLKKERCSYRGVYGAWPYHKLPYVSIQHACWCSMHTFKNICNYSLQALSGARITLNKAGEEVDAREAVEGDVLEETNDDDIVVGSKRKRKVKKKNSQSKSSKLLKYCKFHRMFPSLWRKDQYRPDAPIRPVWQLSAGDMWKVDAVVNTLLCPAGYEQDFQVKNPFEYRKYLNSHASRVILTSLLPFMLRDTDLCGAYKKFYSMLSEDICALYEPFFSDEEIDVIDLCVRETVAVHEGMFSPLDQPLVWHQLVDFAQHIKKLGPLKDWSGFWGEKLIGVIKKHCPIGGAKMGDTIMRRVANVERAAVHNTYFKPAASKEDKRLKPSSVFIQHEQVEGCTNTLSNQYSFSLHKICLESSGSHKKDVIELSDYEVEGLILVMVKEVEKQSLSYEYAVKRSPLYRLYQAYKSHDIATAMKRHRYKFPLCDFFRGVSTFKKGVDYEDGFHLTHEWLEEYTQLNFVDGQNKSCDVVDFVESGTICMLDAVAIRPLFESIQTVNKADIFGIRFSARGANARETDEPVVDDNESNYESSLARRCAVPINKLNELKYNWNRKRNWSSWCKFRMKSNKKNSIHQFGSGDMNNEEYGQLNMFFRLSMQEDHILHGVPFAAVTTRTVIGYSEYDFVDVLCNNHLSFSTMDAKSRVLFVPCSNIVPTALLVSPRDKQNKPMADKTKLHKQSSALTGLISTVADEEIDKLILVELHPFNNKISYKRSMNSLYNNSYGDQL